jgi:callose synthase
MWSFKSSSIATITIFQQLAFLFDFIFCVSLIIPLFIMSGIPFLNVIQTRMMYNEGFSKVMSASSQYAFSVAAFTGILGGTGVGWLFSILSTLESSPSFVSFVTTYEGVLDGDVGDGKTSYIFYGATVVGTIASGFLTFFAGRRLSIVVGGLLTNLGMVAVCAKDDFRKMLLVPGLGVLGCAIGILLPSLTIYIFEISTRDIRGKAVLLLGIGFVLGSLLSAFFSSVNQIGWIWQVFIASIIISITTPGKLIVTYLMLSLPPDSSLLY